MSSVHSSLVTAKLTSRSVSSVMLVLPSVVFCSTMPVARSYSLAVKTAGLRMVMVSPTWPAKSAS